MNKVYLYLGVCLFLVSCSNLNNNSNDTSLTKKKSEDITLGMVNPKAVENNDYDSVIANFGEPITIKLSPFIPEYSTFTNDEFNLLSSRINVALSKFGYGGESSNPRFIVGPAINILSKELTSTAPTQHIITFEVNFIVADVVEQTTYNSYTLSFKGVGQSPTKAFISGFTELDLLNQDFYDFLKLAENKIFDYYQSNCDKFITQAKSDIDIREYESAFNIMNNIPIEATSCFEQTVSLRKEVFTHILNTNCNKYLANMKAELGNMNDASASGFNEEAMAYYKLIDPKSECFSEAEKVYTNYLKGLNPQQKRDWEQKLKEFEWSIEQQKDSLAYNVKLKELETEAEIQGNKKLLEKYKKDQAYEKQPWLRKLFHLGKYDPFDGYDSEGV